MVYFSWNIYFVQDLIEIKRNLRTQTETQTETQTQAIDTLVAKPPHMSLILLLFPNTFQSTRPIFNYERKIFFPWEF